MALFYWYTMTLFWSPATGAAAKTHLRVLMAIKSLYFTFSALQLRNGYPPPASYRYRLTSSYPDSAVCITLQFELCMVHSHVHDRTGRVKMARKSSKVGIRVRRSSSSSSRDSDASWWDC